VPPTSAHSLTAEIINQRALFLVHNIISLSVDAEHVHIGTTSKIQTDVYYRLDPPLGLGNVDLVDCFYADQVEGAVKRWLATPEGKAYTGGIANKLVKRLTVENARYIEPPSPPRETNSNYNPQLDKPRPETMIEYLKNYHVIFVIDDSSSMEDEGRWDETRDALAAIADHALKHNADTVDFCFFNSPRTCTGVKGTAKIMSTFNEVRPYGYTPTGATLNKILNAEIRKLDAAIGTPAYKEIKPLDIIFLTDGIPSDRPGEVLVAACERLKKSKHHPNCIGIQFVQIGNDPGADVALKELMYGNIGNIVDTIPYDGVLSPQKLERILLGGVQPNVRAMIRN